jgi:DNA-binding LytR/AlgR family response regulator
MYDLLVFSHLIHNVAWHVGDEGNQQGLWKVLEERLDQQFNRASRSKGILSD